MILSKTQHFDVAVTGGGPAGLIAAGTAASAGKSVILLEKNDKLGRKLAITGNGRCNITNFEPDVSDLVDKYGKNGNFLFSGFTSFGPSETISFFNSMGLETKVERGKRVFPASDISNDVVKVLISFLERYNVTIRLNSRVRDIKIKDSMIQGIVLEDTIIQADKYIICTGGRSYPSTGSTGDGYTLARSAGHSIVEPAPSIVPLKVKEPWVKDLMGLSLKNTGLTAYTGRKKIISRFGEMLFTHFGISGPIVMDASKIMLNAYRKRPVKIYLDLKPALDHDKLDKRIQRDFHKHKGKFIVSALRDLLPSALIPVVLNISGVENEIRVDELNRSDRKNIVNTIKAIPLTLNGSLGFDWAIVTSGGIALKEIDPGSMRSKLVENLYFAGEVLDLDGPTGGFNLQICWTTGYIAGKAVSFK